MPLIRPGIRRLFSLRLWREDTRPAEIDDEIALHLELRAQQLQQQGLSADEARAIALRRFGEPSAARAKLRIAAKQRDRAMSLREQLSSLTLDARYAVRGLIRERWFTAFVAITLGLGIGVNAAMYGVVDRLLLRGPEYVQHQERLQNLYIVSPHDDGADTSKYFGYVMYATLRDNTHRMRVAAFKHSKNSIIYGSGDAAELWNTADATANLFPLLGVTPLLGRFFTDDEDRVSPSHLVVVLGYNVWQRVYNGDRNVVGKSITLNDKSYIIIGVARKGFTGPQLANVDVWFPSMVRNSSYIKDWATSWDWAGLFLVARLEPGVTAEQAAAEATAAYRGAYNGKHRADSIATLMFAPISYDASGSEPAEVRISRWLIGVCVIVLLVACSNVTNLLLARAVRRRREVAVRLALGVSRARLLRLFLIESMLLSTIGGATGLAVAFATGTFMRKILLPNIDWSSSPLNFRVLTVLLVTVLLVGIVIGLVPAWGASRPDLTTALKSGVRDGGGNRSRTRTALTIAQAAFSVVLLIGAGLFVRSLSNVRGIDLGVETDRVLITGLRWRPMAANATKDAKDAEGRRRNDVYPLLLARMRQLPQVERASLSIGLPFQSVMGGAIRVPGWDSLPKTKGGAPDVSAITSEYFETIGARILHGRAFTPDDRKGSEPVVIVTQTMAKTLWPNTQAVGQCFYTDTDSLTPCARIVGIATDAHRFSLKEEPSMHFFLPYGQGPYTSGANLIVRPRGNVNAAIAAVRRAAQQIDPTVSYVYANGMQETIDTQMRPWQLGANIFVLMGVLALCVAAIGLYSVMSYLVAQRRQELGIRMALGASSQNILRLILQDGVGTASVGIVIGVVAALLGGSFIEPLLFETSPRDVSVFATVILSLAGVSVLASIVPALRARRVNPVDALRIE